ncbi:MAG: 50S ribosomal protein L23 [Nitrospiraceae bacterium]|nr:MAG: 50S ribosomal protein L23 [Nitrospiraceae bacterium]
MRNIYEVLKGPLLTEKGTLMKEQDNKVLFKVAVNANKIEIRKAVEEIFKVKVDRVTTMNCMGKRKRMGKHEGKRSDWKKAIVTLKEGEKLDFVEGV